MLTVSPFYAGLLALLFVGLSLRVVAFRRSQRISLGDGGEGELTRRIRAQGNCAEYVPFGLLLLAMAEFQGMAPWLVHLFGVILLLGRLAHAWALGQEPIRSSGRVGGAGMTFFVIIGLAIANILLSLV